MLICTQQRESASRSQSIWRIKPRRVFLIHARTWFWWEHSDGTLRSGKGEAWAIGDQMLYVHTPHIPPIRSLLDVILHLDSGGDAARFYGKGTVLRFPAPEDGAATGFAAEVVFQGDATASSLDCMERWGCLQTEEVLGRAA